MRDYIAPKWIDTLRRNRLDRFEQLWALDTGWVEEPNRRRGGWSGVMRHQLKRANGDIAPVFIKRQSNHVYRSWQHPFRGEPTFAREMYNILRFKSKGIPVLEPVYFAMRKVHGEQRAILVTEELAGYSPLELLQQRWQQESDRNDRMVKLELIKQLAPVVRKMNSARLQHGCLYPKHVFVLVEENRETGLKEIGDIRLVDLEKARLRLRANSCTRRDLGTLNRYSHGVNRGDRLRFLQTYLQESQLGSEGRRLWQYLARSEEAKRLNKHQPEQ